MEPGIHEHRRRSDGDTGLEVDVAVKEPEGVEDIFGARLMKVRIWRGWRLIGRRADRSSGHMYWRPTQYDDTTIEVAFSTEENSEGSQATESKLGGGLGE